MSSNSFFDYPFSKWDREESYSGGCLRAIISQALFMRVPFCCLNGVFWSLFSLNEYRISIFTPQIKRVFRNSLILLLFGRFSSKVFSFFLVLMVQWLFVNWNYAWLNCWLESFIWSSWNQILRNHPFLLSLFFWIFSVQKEYLGSSSYY